MKLDRRQLLGAGAASLGALALTAGNRTGMAMNMKAGMKMTPPWQWQKEHGVASPVRKDDNPLQDELKKYPRCPYCGMSRRMWNHTRHLIQYEDGTAEGTCSIRCLAVAFAINLDRGPKQIWVADAGADARIKPLIAVDKAYYALVAGKPGTMTMRRKWAFSDKAKAAAQGGEVADFDTALQAACCDLGRDSVMVRKRRAEKRAHMMKKMQMMRRGMK